MQTPADAQAPFVFELFVTDLARSVRFYRDLGFVVERGDSDFVVLRWGAADRLFLAAAPTLAPDPAVRMNVRLLVPDVDARWDKAQSLGCRVHSAIADRPYGLRDFTILDPDGYGVRFASPLKGDGHDSERGTSS